MPFGCESNYDVYMNYLSKISTHCDEIDSSNQGWSKIWPSGRMRPTNQFNSACQIPCTFFPSTTFPKADSSAIALAAFSLLSATAAVSHKQSYKSAKMAWFYCCYCTTIHLNNLLLLRLCKSHCIQHSSGQADANSAFGSEGLATPGPKCVHSWSL